MLNWNKKIFCFLSIILLVVSIVYLINILIFNIIMPYNNDMTLNSTIHKTTLKIMPLGDSITEGDLYGGYRVNLKQMMDNAGFNTDFVGRKTTNGNTTGFIDIEHEGYNPVIGIAENPYSNKIDIDIVQTSKGIIVQINKHREDKMVDEKLFDNETAEDIAFDISCQLFGRGI